MSNDALRWNMTGEGDDDSENPVVRIGENVKDATIANISGSGTGILIEGESSDVTITGQISGFDKAIVHEAGDVSIENAMITGNLIGYIARKQAQGQISNSVFDNIVADIIYHPETDIEKIDAYARRVLELSGGNLRPVEVGRHLHPIEIELNREARKVVSASTEEAKRDHFRKMVEIVREYELSMTEEVILVTAASKCIELALSEMASELPGVLNKLGL